MRLSFWLWNTAEDVRFTFTHAHKPSFTSLFHFVLLSFSATKQLIHTRPSLPPLPTTQSKDNSPFEVKKLVITCEFVAQSEHELTVKKDEEVFTDDKNIDQHSWVWVYSPQTRKSGFVPSFAVRWSQNTTFL